MEGNGRGEGRAGFTLCLPSEGTLRAYAPLAAGEQPEQTAGVWTGFVTRACGHWALAPALPLTSHVTLGKSLNPLSLHLQKRGRKRIIAKVPPSADHGGPQVSLRKAAGHGSVPPENS